MASSTGTQIGHISTYQSRFLSRRSYTRPTGEPLYTYRMSRAEFDELESELREFLAHQLKYAKLGDVARAKPWFSALFVLYAAEWWRREYDGSGWSWEPIVLRLGAPSGSWTQAQRSACVEHGLAQWRIPVVATGGFRFLGSVALQGGLPMKLLAAAQGNIGWVLSRVLRLSADSRCGESEIEDWIRSLECYLPHTYRQSEIFRLLTQVVTTVLSLKRTVALDRSEGAIAKLDAHDPNWRGKFPLPIEDDQARGLIEQLVKDVARVHVTRLAAFATIERSLETDGSDWQMRSTLTLPEYADSVQLTRLFSLAESTDLPRGIVLRLLNRESVYDIAAYKLAGRSKFRIARKVPSFIGADAIAEHVLALVTPDGILKNTTVPKGEPLNMELPWLFEESDKRSARFVRQGSGAVATTQALLCVPVGWKVEPQAEAQAHAVGIEPALARTVWQFKGTVRIIDPAGAVFKCRSGQATAEDDYLGWSGLRATDVEFVSPPTAFRGIPRLCHFSEASGSRSVNGNVLWKRAGQATLFATGLTGPIDTVWPANGDVQWRSRVILLGDARPMLAEPGQDPREGKLRFDGWNLAGVIARTENIKLTSEVNADYMETSFEYLGPGAPPEFIEADLLWRANPTPAKVRLPFPACGARCFDAKGSQLENKAIVSLENLFGIRLVAFLGRTDLPKLRLSLHKKDSEAEVRVIEVPVPSGSTRVELRLIDYLHRLRRMLANGEELDGFVEVELQVGNARTLLRVARYSCELHKHHDAQLAYLRAESVAGFAPDEMSRLAATAIRLNAPGEEPMNLLRDQEISAGIAWKFPREIMDAGPWLIYPSAESPVQFRPLLWTVGLNSNATDVAQPPLTQIMAITEQAARSELLQSAITRISKDFSDNDWQIVEQLTHQLYHLPLCTLDLWRTFARSQYGLAALAMRGHRFPTNFLDRFSSEMSAVWETISLERWITAMRAHLAFAKSNPIAATDLESRIEAIASVQPGLRVLLEVAESVCTGSPTQSVQLAMRKLWDFGNQLFSGPDSSYQRLLRECANLQWPNELQKEINSARGTSLGRFFHKEDLHFRDVIVNLPILLGTSAATGVPVPWLSECPVVTLRKYQDFCPDWFADAFDLTIARCISAGAIELLGS